ncbi:MAG: type IV pili methyl-accepting chemotaxis transducer N-terminal domain-containing protein [Pseudomonadota bacterium]
MKYSKIHFISILFTISCLNFAAYAATQQEMLKIIDLAGKQRMLTQKMSKEILLIINDIEPEENKNHLYKTAALFNQTLNGLFNGDSNLGLVEIDKPSIKQKLKKVSKFWHKFRINVDVVLLMDENTQLQNQDELLKDVAQQNLQLLEYMEDVVDWYQDESKSTVQKHYEEAVTLNEAGRQRMRTQKMTKELLLMVSGINLDSREELAKTMFDFEQTLIGLLKGNREQKLLLNELNTFYPHSLS